MFVAGVQHSRGAVIGVIGVVEAPMVVISRIVVVVRVATDEMPMHQRAAIIRVHVRDGQQPGE